MPSATTLPPCSCGPACACGLACSSPPPAPPMVPAGGKSDEAEPWKPAGGGGRQRDLATLLLCFAGDFYYRVGPTLSFPWEVGALLPVVGTLLQFSPDELKKCQQGVLSSVASSQAAAVSDGTTTQNSFFARFSF